MQEKDIDINGKKEGNKNCFTMIVLSFMECL
jgi:hypothetical protein